MLFRSPGVDLGSLEAAFNLARDLDLQSLDVESLTREIKEQVNRELARGLKKQ